MLSQKTNLNSNLALDISHILLDHESKCDICGTRFIQSTDLKTLIVLVHEGNKPFKCAICDTRFAENSDFVSIISILSTPATRYTYYIALTP